MERLIKELIQVEKKRNLLLSDISKSLEAITSSNNLYRQTLKDANEIMERVGTSALSVD